PLAGSPPTWPRTCTPPSIGTRTRVPLTRLPEAEASATRASCAVLVATGSAGAGGAGATGSVVLQPASRARAARAGNAIRGWAGVFMHVHRSVERTAMVSAGALPGNQGPRPPIRDGAPAPQRGHAAQRSRRRPGPSLRVTVLRPTPSSAAAS